MWWDYPHANIGTPTFDHRWVLDVDPRHGGDETLRALETTYAPLPRTVTGLTGGGGTHLVWGPLSQPWPPGKIVLGQGLDLQNVGHYIVLPSSIHPDTKRPYRWEADFGPDDLPPQPPPPWLEALIFEAAAHPKTRSHRGEPSQPVAAAPIPEGRRENTLVRMAGGMRRTGATVEEMRAALEVMNHRCVPPLPPEDLDRIAHSVGRYDPAPSAATLAVNSQLPATIRPEPFSPYGATPAVARFAGYSGISGQPVLADVATHYGVPLERTSERELAGPHPQHGRDTGDTLIVNPSKGYWHCPRHGTGGNAFALIAVCEGLLACEHAPSETFTEDLVHRVWRIANDKFPIPQPDASSSVQWGNTSCQWGKNNFGLTSLSDLFNEPEEEVAWLVDDLLPGSGFSLLVAKPKVGKTTLARNLALCVAQGKDFLGRKTQQGLVIYLALEEKRSEVRKHFRDMGATGTEDIHLSVASAPADGLQQVRAAAERLKPVLIIIDPLFRLTRVKDSNDYAQVTQALEPLLVLARETGAHVLCVHHAGKGNREGGDSILGSTAIFGTVDTALMMRKMEGYRTLQSEQRYGASLEETVLRYDATTRTVSLGDTKEAEDLTRLSQAISEYLQGQTAPVTEAVIDDTVEGRRGLRKKALRQLVAEGKVTRHGKGGKADPFTYALADIPSQQDSGSLVPGRVVGTTKPEPKNSGIASNDAADSGPQALPKVENSREPESDLGNHNLPPAPVAPLDDVEEF
jgi:hypothetical protein